MKQPITPEQQEWLFQNRATITFGPVDHYEVKVHGMPTFISPGLQEAIDTIEKERAKRKSSGLSNVPLDEYLMS